jgi:TPR repeat protein
MHDPVEGIELLKLASAQGHARAQFALADAYRTGQLGQNDIPLALYWYEKAALRDDARARNSWAVALYLGRGTERNPVAAARLFQIAAQQDLAAAQYNLGVLYDLGQGVTLSPEKARAWYTKAGGQRYGPAEYRLGMLWELGLGGQKDRGTALTFYASASMHGSVPAMLRLGPAAWGQWASTDYYLAGVALLNGNGVPRDERKGVSYLEKSAQMQYSPALFDLGVAYANARGVKKNEAKAIEYYEKVIDAKRAAPDGSNLINDRTFASSFNNIAWVMITSTDAKIRDPQKALTYALKGVELSEARQPFALDTLAYAYFQTGQVDKAIETETKALAMQPQNQTYAKTLAEFKEKQKSR